MKYIHFVFLLAFVFCGCKKWNLKQPSSLSINWRFNTTSTSQNKVVINSGYFYSGNFIISGERKEGDPILIEQTLPIQKILFKDYQSLGFSLDVPMGDYIQFDMQVKIDNSKSPALRLVGTVQRGEETLPLILEWFDCDHLTFSMLNSFFLKKKKNYDLYIGFDVRNLLDNISTNFWNNTQVTSENGVPTVVVNNVSHPNLFSKINQNLSKALILSIE